MDYKNSFTLVLLLSGFFLAAQTGIGTTTPVNKLQVETATADPATTGLAANGNLRLSGTTGTQVLDFGVGTTTYSWLQSRSKSAYGTNYSLALNPNGGFVGIGTTIPTSLLTVGKADGTSTAAELVLNPSAATNEGGQIVIKKSLNGSVSDWTIDQVGSSSANARFRIFSTGELAGLTILENGYVGLGNIAPTVRLHVSGDIIANSVAGTSDRRFKTNIHPVDNALAKVKALQGVYFNWNQKDFPEKDFGSQNELGLIAQEVEKVVPEIVSKDNSKEEYRSVKYDKLVALLVEAMKEQQKQIEQLQLKVKQLTKKRKK
jgi:Chaperone of endosialidase